MQLKVEKRNGQFVDFDVTKIQRAIESAMFETSDGIDKELSIEISEKIKDDFQFEDSVNINQIQDKVELYLMDSKRKDVAVRYILYRANKDKERKMKPVVNSLLSDDFISNYKHIQPPMTELGTFVYYRTYSRFLKNLGRREFWYETVKRAVEYNASIVPTSKEEAEKLFDNIFNLRQFVSGRTFWIGNTEISKEYALANFNCAFTKIDSFESFSDLFYLLMLGCGVGLRVLPDDIKNLSKVRTDYKLFNAEYQAVPKNFRRENTSIDFYSKDSVEINVGDSKEGWVEALRFFFEILTKHNYKHVKSIIINYSSIRPKGEALKRFGGTSSGYETMMSMFKKIDNILKKRSSNTGKPVKLNSVDCLDIANIIGENVVVGGVRRTAEMIIVDQNDNDAINAKSDLYTFENNVWNINQEIAHRQMSNNSIYFVKKPTKEELHTQLERMRYSGEPGFINAIAAEKRRENMNGLNPCGEILLDSNGVCNLTTVNVLAFVNDDNKIDVDDLLEAQRLSARAGFRMTMLELELPHWNKVQQRDRLLGCSLTGWQDMVNRTGMTKEAEEKLLSMLRKTARDAADEYAKELGVNAPLLVTTVKPEGTLSQLPTVSSGVHYSHSPYFIRRVRISANDPMVKAAEELQYPIFPEVGQEMETASTKVVEFPVEAPKGITKNDVSAIKQLENYLMFMKYYVDHNCSITVHVRDDEWQQVEDFVWEHWDDIVAVSFIPLSDSFYKLMPYEEITESEYLERKAKITPFSATLISKYETQEEEYELENECSNGICPIR